MVQKPAHHGGQLGDDGGELVDRPTAAEFLGVVHDRLEAQHAFAFGIALQRQTSEVDFEQGQVILRCLDHDCQPWRSACAVAVRTGLGAEQGAQDRYVQTRAAPVDHHVEDPVHLGVGAEQQIAAVLDLVDRVVVAEATAPLFVDIQTEAQARGVDPPVADLAQPPYSRILRQGVCDLSQGLRVGHRGEAVAFHR
jgi:hypothetical protein